VDFILVDLAAGRVFMPIGKRCAVRQDLFREICGDETVSAIFKT
jgi:hypothetical protein